MSTQLGGKRPTKSVKRSLLPRVYERSFIDAVAVVIGGGASFGRTVSTTLAARGANVVLVDVDRLSAEAVAQEITDCGGKASVFEADMTRPDGLDALADAIVATVGPIDIVVNYAGEAFFTLPNDLAECDWTGARSAGLDSVIHACRTFGGRLRSSGFGQIVNVVSVPQGSGTYQMAASTALLAFSDCLRSGLAEHGVGVSVVRVGGGQPEEVATALCQAIEHDKAIVLVGRQLGNDL